MRTGSIESFPDAVGLKPSKNVTAVDGTHGIDKRQMAKLEDGARQFEAMMLQQMLKSSNFGESPDAAGEESSGGASETIWGFGTEAIAKAIAIKGGFGMAQQIIRQVTAEHMAAEPRKGGF